MMLHVSSYLSPLGRMTMASDGKAIVGLWFEGQLRYGSTLNGRVLDLRDDVMVMATDWLDCYFGGGRPDFVPPVRLMGSEFGMTVGEILMRIPYGETMSYGEVGVAAARMLGRDRMSAQAVGGAVGRNAISIIVPCHRVVGADGKLTGYAGGLERKRALLEIEGIVLR